MIVTTGTTGHAAELYLGLGIAELRDNMFQSLCFRLRPSPSAPQSETLEFTSMMVKGLIVRDALGQIAPTDQGLQGLLHEPGS